jgi:hypothetical protein
MTGPRFSWSMSLTGVTIDKKLSFNKHASQLSIDINKKLFGIKRLFYLPYAVKLQFFKTFILPHFDYGMTLAIYFHSKAIQKICKSYYFCLHKLLGYKFPGMSHTQINDTLSEDNIPSFNHRLVSRLLIFIHKTSYDRRGPVQLREWLEPATLLNKRYNLRSNNRVAYVPTRVATRFGDTTFFNFFCNFLNKINFVSLSKNFKDFEFELKSNINLFLSSLLTVVPKFNTKLDFYFYYIS